MKECKTRRATRRQSICVCVYRRVKTEQINVAHYSSQKVSSCSILKHLSDLPSYGGVDNSVRIAVENRESSVRT